MCEGHEWIDRMSVEDMAAEISSIFDIDLDLARRIAEWIKEPIET